MEANVLSLRTLQLCREWLRVCTREHAACEIPITPFVPTRLIDVGDALSLDLPRLISTDREGWAIAYCMDSNLNKLRLRDTATQYLAFSYCWGSLEVSVLSFRTTKDNVYQRGCGIFLDILPKTFRDFFTVVRELGLRYAWIDSLCIVQDDPKDLAREIGRMGDVYGQAYLTVASALDTSSSDGLLRVRNHNRSAFQIPFATYAGSFVTGSYSLLRNVPESFTFDSDIENSGYNHRGWTFQERFLSRRVLYFSETILYYECQEFQHSENSAAIHRRYMWPRWCPKQELESLGSNSLYRTWYNYVAAYSGRHLTYKSDKLPAIAGLAATMWDALQTSGIVDTYLAGLWKRDLLKGLLWTRTLDCDLWRTLDDRAPSWCWSAFDGKIHYPEAFVKRRMESRCSIIEVAMQNGDTNPFGRVTSGRLQIMGRLKHIDSVQLKEAENSSAIWYRRLHHFLKDDRVVAYGKLDSLGVCDCTDCGRIRSSGEYRGPEEQHNVWILLLADAHPDEGEATDNHSLPSWPVGLVLTPTKSLKADAEYRRIGIFCIEVEHDIAVNGDPTIFDTCEERTITIV